MLGRPYKTRMRVESALTKPIRMTRQSKVLHLVNQYDAVVFDKSYQVLQHFWLFDTFDAGDAVISTVTDAPCDTARFNHNQYISEKQIPRPTQIKPSQEHRWYPSVSENNPMDDIELATVDSRRSQTMRSAGMRVTIKNLYYSLADCNRRGHQLYLLSGVDGCFEPGQMTALVSKRLRLALVTVRRTVTTHMLYSADVFHRVYADVAGDFCPTLFSNVVCELFAWWHKCCMGVSQVITLHSIHEHIKNPLTHTFQPSHMYPQSESVVTRQWHEWMKLENCIHASLISLRWVLLALGKPHCWTYWREERLLAEQKGRYTLQGPKPRHHSCGASQGGCSWYRPISHQSRINLMFTPCYNCGNDCMWNFTLLTQICKHAIQWAHMFMCLMYNKLILRPPSGEYFCIWRVAWFEQHPYCLLPHTCG